MDPGIIKDDKSKAFAQEVGADFFGEIPIDTRIRFGGDAGVPIVASSPDSEHTARFMDIATKTAMKIAGAVLSKPKRSPRLAGLIRRGFAPQSDVAVLSVSTTTGTVLLRHGAGRRAERPGRRCDRRARG